MPIKRNAVFLLAGGVFAGWLLFSGTIFSSHKHMGKYQTEKGMTVEVFHAKDGIVPIVLGMGYLKIRVTRKDRSKFDLCSRYSYDWGQDIDLHFDKNAKGQYVLQERWIGVSWIIEER